MANPLIECWINRDRNFTMPILQADGSAFALASATDVVHLRIGRDGDILSLELSSAGATANGSTLTFTDGNNTAVCYVNADDTADLERGAYDYELEVVRSGNPLHVQDGVFFLHPVPAGA